MAAYLFDQVIVHQLVLRKLRHLNIHVHVIAVIVHRSIVVPDNLVRDYGGPRILNRQMLGVGPLDFQIILRTTGYSTP
ncbi:hypothetical protein D3C73_1263330 [compost metagenome]